MDCKRSIFNNSRSISGISERELSIELILFCKSFIAKLFADFVVLMASFRLSDNCLVFLSYSTLQELKFDISYHTIGNIKVSETYISPIRVESENVALLKGKSIIVECIDDKQFILIDESSKKQVIYNFGEEINFYDAKIIIDLNVQHFSIYKKRYNTLITFKDLTKLTQTYQNKISRTEAGER